MADNSSTQRAEITGLSEDDPFAELTRIMGHEPRREAAPDPVSGEDLALELENELLSDLAGDVSENTGEAVPPQQAAQQEQQPDWRAELSEEQPAAPDEEAHADALVDELDAGLASTFEDEFHGSEAAAEPFGEPETGFAHEEPEALQAHQAAAPSGPEAHRPEPAERFEADDGDWVPNDWAPMDSDFGAPPVEAELTPEPVQDAPETGELEDRPVSSVEELEAGQPEAPAPGDAAQSDYAEAAASLPHERLSTDKHYLSPHDFAQSLAQERARGGEQEPETAPEQPEAEEFSLGHAQSEEPDAGLEEPMPAQAPAEAAPAEAAPAEAAPTQAVEPAPWETPEQPPSFELFEPVAHEQPASEDFPAAAPQAHSAPVDDAVSADHATPVDDTPYVDTVDVPGEGVTVDDARHIPEFKSEPEPASAARFDDLEAVLARAFGDSDAGHASPYAEQDRQQPDFTHGNETPEPASAEPAVAEGADERHDDFGFDAAFAAGLAASQPATPEPAYAADEAAVPEQEGIFWDEPQQEQASHPQAEPEPQDRNRRGLLVAAAVGGVALLGAFGVFALTSGGGESAAPVLVQADDEPMKVRPENPGGQQVLNQDNQVYQRVAGEEADAAPEQETLVSTAEEPADVTPPPARQAAAEDQSQQTGQTGQAPQTQASAGAGDDNGQAVAKSEERLESEPASTTSAIGQEVAAVSPRRVRTMIVRPDGTMVPREVSEPVESASDAAARTAATAITDGQETLAGAQDAASVLTGAQLPVDTGQSTAAVESDAANGAVPNSAPIPVNRPASAPPQQQAAASQQGTPPAAQRTQPQQTAAVAPQQTAPAPAAVSAPTGEWSVQISSQPTVEGAQQSYRDIAQRHGDLLAGKGVNIVKADIEGKGTYYRVRIPSASKDSAIQLCSQLKSAGASCFVSK